MNTHMHRDTHLSIEREENLQDRKSENEGERVRDVRTDRKDKYLFMGQE